MRSFILAQSDPFHEGARGACIPDGDGGMTFKFCTRNTMLMSNDFGEGMTILVHPTAGSDSYSLTVNKNISAGQTLDSLTGGDGSLSVGSPFPASSFSLGNLEQRCVGWGLRVTNASAPLNTAGTMYGYSEMSHAVIGGSATSTSIVGRSATVRETMHRCLSDPFTLLKGGSEWTELTNFHDSSFVDGSNGVYAAGSRHAKGLVYIPQNASSTHVRIELVAHWEARGRTVTPFASLSEIAEPASAQAVWGAITQAVRGIQGSLPSNRILFDIGLQAYRYHRAGRQRPVVRLTM
jgi:hypothetical protein